jgi:hypothetical protein
MMVCWRLPPTLSGPGEILPVIASVVVFFRPTFDASSAVLFYFSKFQVGRNNDSSKIFFRKQSSPTR